MSRRVTITARAQMDLAEIREWYGTIRSELVEQFQLDFDAKIEAISERPGSFPITEFGVRRALCEIFPYKIYFTDNTDEIRILAVYHAMRDPRHWSR